MLSNRCKYCNGKRELQFKTCATTICLSRTGFCGVLNCFRPGIELSNSFCKKHYEIWQNTRWSQFQDKVQSE